MKIEWSTPEYDVWTFAEVVTPSGNLRIEVRRFQTLFQWLAIWADLNEVAYEPPRAYYTRASDCKEAAKAWLDGYLKGGG